jgi:hypothetical protein
MNKYKLLEEKAGLEKDVLPIFYKKIQYEEKDFQDEYLGISSIYTKSERHQTNTLVSCRFYKPISLFKV